ncbi:MAG: MMPL family transporter [Candidatus Wallbacteria bacterium]|nr:MMPL family transporter [Candidatus Wallbacteria bacterium]
MKAMQDIDAARTEALQEIRKVLQEEVASRGLGYAVGGIGVIYDALNQITVTEGGVLIALSYLVIITAMMLILRNWRFAFLGLGVVYVTVTATMGIYALRGHMLNMVTVILPSMLLVIIIMDFVHVVMNFYHCGPIPKSREERRLTVIERVGHIALPCFYTSLTNGTGFLALAISPISLVRDLGLYGALGSFLEWGVTIPICALALYWMDPVVDFHPTSPEGWMQRLLSWMTQRVIAHRVAVSSAVLAVTAFFTWGMTRIVVDTYTIGYFRESHPVRSDHAFIEKNFGYYIPIELTVKAAKGKTFKDPAMLEKLQRIEECLLAEPVISKVLSLLPFSKRVHQVLNGGEPAKYQIPPSRQAASQELLLYEMDPDASLDQYMTRDYAFGRVSGRMKMMSVRPGKVMMEKLDGRLQGIMGADGHPEFAGYLPLYVKIIDYLVQSQIQSFTLAFLLVFGPMYLLFRSVRLTIISIVPNVLPVIYTLGFMGWAGIPLDIATVTIASIVLGIVVDDTIHFLHGFRERWDAGMDPRQATVEVIESTGKAVVTSTLMMFFGFSVMGISSVKPIAYFGVLSGMSFIAGVVCEFLVTPVLLIVFYPKPCPTPVLPGQ